MYIWAWLTNARYTIPCWLHRLNLKLDVPDEEIDNKFREQFFNFYDDRLMDLAWAKELNPDHTIQFFRLLALCNTIIPDGVYAMGAS